MGLSQKEATYNAVKSTLEAKGVTFEDGEDVGEAVTTDTKKEIKAILFEGFRDGTISYTENFAKKILGDDSELNKYISGLISNWLKKDKRLNGNTQYKPENPGSRAGQGDDQVKELQVSCEQIETRGNEKREQDEAKHQEEVDFLKQTNEQLKKNLESLLSAPKK